MTVRVAVRASSARKVAVSVFKTAQLVAGGRLHSPNTWVDRTLRFADGTTARVYRETVLTKAPVREPTLLVVGFRLRLIRRNRLLHAAFRVESLANTPLFAGFPGFRSKLWVTDLVTGVYRGIYEWDGARLAEDYVTALSAVLRPFCVPGSIRYHIEAGIHRDDFLRDPSVISERTGGTEWWMMRPSDR